MHISKIFTFPQKSTNRVAFNTSLDGLAEEGMYLMDLSTHKLLGFKARIGICL